MEFWGVVAVAVICFYYRHKLEFWWYVLRARRSFGRFSRLNKEVQALMASVQGDLDRNVPTDLVGLELAQKVVKSLEVSIGQLQHVRAQANKEMLRLTRVDLAGAEADLRKSLKTAKSLLEQVFERTRPAGPYSGKDFGFDQSKVQMPRTSPAASKRAAPTQNRSAAASNSPGAAASSTSTNPPAAKFDGGVSSSFPSAASEERKPNPKAAGDRYSNPPVYGNKFCSQPGCHKPTKNGICSDHLGSWGDK